METKQNIIIPVVQTALPIAQCATANTDMYLRLSFQLSLHNMYAPRTSIQSFETPTESQP